MHPLLRPTVSKVPGTQSGFSASCSADNLDWPPPHMLAITTLLSPPNAARINTIIKRLEKKFGLDDVQATPDPHLTYQLAGVQKLSALKEVLTDVAAI